MRGVPLACHLFPIRDDPSAIASGQAEPVVSPGCSDLQLGTCGTAISSLLLCRSQESGPLPEPEPWSPAPTPGNLPRGSVRPGPAQRCGPARAGSTTMFLTVGVRVARAFARSPHFPGSFVSAPPGQCLSRILRQRCLVVCRSPVDGPLLSPAGLPEPLDAVCCQELSGDRGQSSFDDRECREHVLSIGLLPIPCSVDRPLEGRLHQFTVEAGEVQGSEPGRELLW